MYTFKLVRNGASRISDAAIPEQPFTSHEFLHTGGVQFIHQLA